VHRPPGRHVSEEEPPLKNLTGLVVCALAACAVVAPVTTAYAAPAPAAHARAAATSWTVIETGFKAKHDACKVSDNGGAAWKIYNRLDARKVTGGRLRAAMTVTHNGAMTSHTWTSGWVHKGDVSPNGSVTIPRKSSYGLEMSLAGDNAGSGGELTPADIGRC
jgi:hypothetical protein